MKLEATAQQMAQDDQQLALEATDHKRVRAAVDRFDAALCAIGIFVDIAGMQHRTAVEDFTTDGCIRQMQLDIARVFHVGLACARHMIGRGRGKITSTASVQAALTRPGVVP